MKLWLLEINDWDYDCNVGYVIRAKTELEARELADENAADENWNDKHPWLDSTDSTCIEVTEKGKAEVILTSFNAG